MLDEIGSVPPWCVRSARCQTHRGHNFDHYRFPLYLFFSEAGRERKNRPNFLSNSFCCRWSRRKEQAEFSEWTYQLPLQDKEQKSKSLEDHFVYLCIQYSELAVRLSRCKSHRRVRRTGCSRLRSLGFAQWSKFSIKGGKATAFSRIIIVMTPI